MKTKTSVIPCFRGSVTVMWPVYIELHTSSAFSFLRAASLPETLIDRAATLGYPAVGLLDRDGVSGAPRFHKAALAAGLKPLIGAELTIEACQQANRPNRPTVRQPRFHFRFSAPHKKAGAISVVCSRR